MGAPSFDIYSFNVGCDQVPHVSQGACKGDSAVYRISFGLFLWFIFNTFGTLFGGKKFHTGWWILKILLFVVLIVGAFFVPNAVFGAGVGHDGLSVAGSYGYAQFSRIISAFFLVSQIVAFIDFAYHWNYSWKNNAYGGEDDEESEVTDSKWLVGLEAAFSFNLLLTVTGIILLYVFYGACSLSAFFITITAIAVVGFTCLQLTMPDSDSSLLTSSVVALYSVYLCWTCYSATSSATTVTAGPSVSATRSKNEAEDELKQPLNGPTSNKLRSVSEDDRSSEHKKKDIEADNDQDIMDDEEDRQDAPGTAGGQSPDSRIWFFHVVMAAGSLYLAMVLTDWGTGSVSGGIHNATTATPSSSGTSQVSVYVSNSTGVAQMWVKIISEWFAIGLYTWSLIAPRIFPDREFN